MAKYEAWCPELVAELADPFPAQYVEAKTLKGNSISFVPWYRYTAKLTYLVGSG